MKSLSLHEKIRQSLVEARILIENRRTRPAVIYMRRGTIIPVHHYRKVTSPSGSAVLIAGIGPGLFREVKTGGYSVRRHWMHRMRDFWAPGNWIPNVRAVRRGWQDETGWSEPNERGHYDASRDFEIMRKFEKVLTMNPRNIAKIEPLPPGTDPRSYEPRVD